MHPLLPVRALAYSAELHQQTPRCTAGSFYFSFAVAVNLSAFTLKTIDFTIPEYFTGFSPVFINQALTKK